MLSILEKDFDVDPSNLRFLRTVLVHPAGFNLRNLMSHGLADGLGAAVAALLVYVVLMLGTAVPSRGATLVPDM